MRQRIGRVAVLLAVIAATLAAAPGAWAQVSPPVPELRGVTPLSDGVERLSFTYGPIHITPGDNMILVGPVTIEKPQYDGYVTRIRPDLVYGTGEIPDVDVIHLHHGVWLNLSGGDVNSPFFAAGEEKTILDLPDGYGYPVRQYDGWALNYMIHNQTPKPDNVWITYEVDYVRADSDAGRAIEPVEPVWNDVVGGLYPVFDVKREMGGPDGLYTYPDDAGGAERRTMNRDGTLVSALGHVHPGGLYTDIELERPGKGRKLIFRSEANYFDPNGPISWDMAMSVADPDWRVGVKAGDQLKLSATYETERASWYESMGIVLAFFDPKEAGDQAGPDPFATGTVIDTQGEPTHGHLPENDNHGGTGETPLALTDGQTVGNNVGIAGFFYLPGDLNLGAAGPLGQVPVVQRGQSLTFDNFDAAGQIYHTITSCREPCNGASGISYPLANGPIDFDSAELGYGIPTATAAANKYQWKTPTDLPAATYTYFCRIHPFMRGAFRVKD